MRASGRSFSRAVFSGLGLALLVVFLGTASQCGYNPDPPDGQLGCSAKSECPEGFSCRTDNKCWKPGATGGSTGAAGTTGAGGKAGSGGSGGSSGGSGGAPGMLPLESFIGKWIFDDTSTLTQACGVMSMTSTLKDDYVDVVANAKPNTVSALYFCPWVLDVPLGGTVGTIEPNQTCMSTDMKSGAVFTWHGTSFTFTTTDGTNATLSAMIAATYVNKDNTTGACTVRITGRLKVQ